MRPTTRTALSCVGALVLGCATSPAPAPMHGSRPPARPVSGAQVGPSFDRTACTAAEVASPYGRSVREIDWCNLNFGQYGLAFTGGQAVMSEPESEPEGMRAELLQVQYGELDEQPGEEATALVWVLEGGVERWELHLFTMAGDGATWVTKAPAPPGFEAELEVGRGEIVHRGPDSAGRACEFTLILRSRWQLVAGDYECGPAKPSPADEPSSPALPTGAQR